jgi:prepilin-type N-terminal cleavage/methylation domain-containing protein
MGLPRTSRQHLAKKRLIYIGSRGVTLVEMLIVMGLLSIFLTLMATIFTATLDSQSQSETYAAVASDARFLMAQLNYALSQATAITSPASLGASSNNLTLTVQGNPYTYAISGNTLQLTDNIGAASLSSDGALR